jgi:hypothetical protein
VAIYHPSGEAGALQPKCCRHQKIEKKLKLLKLKEINVALFSIKLYIFLQNSFIITNSIDLVNKFEYIMKFFAWKYLEYFHLSRGDILPLVLVNLILKFCLVSEIVVDS